MVELPMDDIARFIGHCSLGRDVKPPDLMGFFYFPRVKNAWGFLTYCPFQGIAEVAEEYWRSQGEIIDQQDFQLHWTRAENSLGIFLRMEEQGFVTDMCRQGYYIFVGGKFGMITSAERLVKVRVPAEAVPQNMGNLGTNYLVKKSVSEKLRDFCKLHCNEELRSYLGKRGE